MADLHFLCAAGGAMALLTIRERERERERFDSACTVTVARDERYGTREDCIIQRVIHCIVASDLIFWS